MRHLVVRLLPRTLCSVRFLYGFFKLTECVLLTCGQPQDFARPATLHSPVPAVQATELVSFAFRELEQGVARNDQIRQAQV